MIPASVVVLAWLVGYATADDECWRTFKPQNRTGDVTFEVPKYAEKQAILGVRRYSVLVFDGGLCADDGVKMKSGFKVRMFAHNEQVAKIHLLEVRKVGRRGYADYALAFRRVGETTLELGVRGRRWKWGVRVVGGGRRAEGERILQFVEARYAAAFTLECFPGAARVGTGAGVVRMSEVALGQRVADSGIGDSPVYMFSHRDPDAVARFVRVQYRDMRLNVTRMLTASPGHYVWTTARRLRAMDELQVGDALLDAQGRNTLRITRVSDVVDLGLYNPHTISGSLVVDGVLVSSYTRAVTPASATSALCVIRAFHRLIPSTWPTQTLMRLIHRIHLLSTSSLFVDIAYFFSFHH